MHVPSWFKKSLSVIDPSYYVHPNEDKGLYEIVRDVDFAIPFRGGMVARITGPKIVDVFRYLNDSSLDHLRYRKWLGRRMNIIENPQKELAYLEAQEKAAMAKERELGFEMMADGMMEGYRIERKHSVS